ncbi:glutaredoxin-C4-like [Pecten maximus]|uniref:glutaredoxin-C4-like n=1 Tax=Pecten maximus TaxID=6579 RepID=UPI0014590509|nr:glutaredoxin-C4-like [Pecten maximus]
MPTKEEIQDTIGKHKVVVYSKSFCPYCSKAKQALNNEKIEYHVIELDGRSDMDSTQDILCKLTGARSVPRVFVNGKFFGGGDDTVAAVKNGKLKELL